MRDERVLEAIAQVPRERFVPAALHDRAYENVALPIARGQMISQPLVVALMLELLELTGTERVLDVGTGSGYHAALLARLARQVWSIERDAALSRAAAATLAAVVGVDAVTCRIGDGWLGLPESAPYEAINVAAAGPAVPEALIEQLAVGGRLVAPVTTGARGGQELLRLTRTADGVTREACGSVRFVPLVRSPRA